MLFVQPRKWLAHPRSGVHAVGDRIDTMAREHRARYLAVLPRHAVCKAAEIQSKDRRVEDVVLAVQIGPVENGMVADDGANAVNIETVVPGFDGCVRREHTPGSGVTQ